MAIAELERRRRRSAERILDEVERAVVGKRDALELVLLGLLADGHVLIEDYPGLAKTLLARSFAQVTDLRLPAHPVHARPDALRRHRLVDLQPAQRPTSSSGPARSSPTSCSPTRSTAPRRRRRPRCSRRCRSGRSRSRARRGRSSRRSSCSRRRTRSSTRAPTRCRRRSSTASCCGSASATRTASDEWEVLERRVERAEDEVELDAGRRPRRRCSTMQRGARAGARLRVGRPLHGRRRRGDARERARAGRREPARLARAAQAVPRAAPRSTAATSSRPTT